MEAMGVGSIILGVVLFAGAVYLTLWLRKQKTLPGTSAKKETSTPPVLDDTGTKRPRLRGQRQPPEA